MSEKPEKKTFRDCVTSINEYAKTNETVTLFELSKLLGSFAHYILAGFLVLFLLQPIPLPIISNAISFIIALSGYCIVFEKPLWMPDILKKYTLKQVMVMKLCVYWDYASDKMSGFIRKRGNFFVNHEEPIRRINGLFILLFGLFMCIPWVVPGADFLPSLGILFLCLAALQEDELMIVIGYFILVSSLFIFFGILLPVIKIANATIVTPIPPK